jgi:hypothetical protein
MGLFTKTYDGIIKGFQKTIDDLLALADANSEKVSVTAAKISNLSDERTALLHEGDKALKTAGKLKALLDD